MKTSPPFILWSDFQGRAGPWASPHPFIFLCQLQAPRLSPEMPLLHRFVPFSCFPDGNGLLNKLPDFFFPLGISFQCYLVTSVFLQSDDVQEHKTQCFFRRLPTSSSCGRFRPPRSRSVPMQWGSLTLWCGRDSSCPSCWTEVRTTLSRFADCLFACLVLRHWTYYFLPRAFLQGFSRLPGAVTGLVNMAQEGEERLENRTGCCMLWYPFMRVLCDLQCKTIPLCFFHL